MKYEKKGFQELQYTSRIFHNERYWYLPPQKARNDGESYFATLKNFGIRKWIIEKFSANKWAQGKKDLLKFPSPFMRK